MRLWPHQLDAPRRVPPQAAVHFHRAEHVSAAGPLQHEEAAVHELHYADDSAGDQGGDGGHSKGKLPSVHGEQEQRKANQLLFTNQN